METTITNNEKETYEFSQDIGKALNKGAVFALSGDLGTGKTMFTKGLAKGMGCKKNITSPTFVIMKVYPVDNPNIKELCHIDAYRLSNEDALAAIGALDYINRDDVVTVIEWPEKIQKLLPDEVKVIEINHLGEDKREILLK